MAMYQPREDKKYTAVELSEFCYEVKCPWVKNVNFGNDVHIPHCVLRGGEVRPHYRCKHVDAFIKYFQLSEKDIDTKIETIREDE